MMRNPELAYAVPGPQPVFGSTAVPVPLLSVIVPVRNEEQCIRTCLDSIFGQDLPGNRFEILVLDGDSSDRTRSICEELQRSHPSLRVIDNPKKSVTAALNIGIRESRGRYFVRCDAHAAYGRDYLSSCLQTAEATGAANVGGYARPLPTGSTLVAQAIVLAHENPFGLGGARFRTGSQEGYAETVWPGCYRKEIFARIGGYNELLPRSEDIDLNARLARAGYKCYLSNSIRAWYYCRPDLAGLFKQRLSDGMGVIQTLPVNAPAVRPRHLIPLAALVLFLLLLPLCLFSIPAILLGTLVSIYAALSLLFSARSYFAERHALRGTPVHDAPSRIVRPGAAFLLPLVFATLHLAYGIGSLAGLLTLPGFIGKLRRETR